MAEKTLKIIIIICLAHTRWSRFFYQASNVHHSLTLALHSGGKSLKMSHNLNFHAQNKHFNNNSAFEFSRISI